MTCQTLAHVGHSQFYCLLHQLASFSNRFYLTATGEDEEGSEEDQEEEEEKEDEEEGEEEEKKGEADWCKIENKELQGYATGERVSMEDLSQAKSACGAMSGLPNNTVENYQVRLIPFIILAFCS